MARLFDDGSLEYLSYANAIVTTPPFTMWCWFRSDDLTIAQTLMGIGDTAGVVYNYHCLQAAGHVASDPVRAITKQEGVAQGNAETTTGYSANTWHHAVGVWAATDDRRAYIDGGSKDTEASDLAPTGLDETTISSFYFPGGRIAYMSGAIVEAAIWRNTISDGEILRGAKHRLSALLVRPQALVAYWPLRHGDNADWLGKYPMLPTNGPIADIASPPIAYPERDDPVWGLVLPRYRPRRYWVLNKSYVRGTTTWGHDTGVVETNIRDFSGNWTGTGTVDGSGDNERIELSAGEYMESEVVNTGAYLIELDQNYYSSGDDVTMKYRHGVSEAACKAAAFGAYTVPFDSLGYVQIRLESTL